MFAVGELSLEALVWKDVAEFRGVEVTVGALEEFEIGVIQFNRVFFRPWSARVFRSRQSSSLSS